MFHHSRLQVHVHVVKCKTWQNLWTVGESNWIINKVFWSVIRELCKLLILLILVNKKCLLLLVLVLLIVHSIFRNTLLWFQEDVVPSLQDHFLPLEYGRKIVARQPFVSNRYIVRLPAGHPFSLCYVDWYIF